MPKYLPIPSGHDFAHLSKNESNPRARVRLLMLSQLSQDIECKVVAQYFDVNPITVRNLLKKYHQVGLAAIYDEQGRGRKTLLPKEQYKQAQELIVQTQKELGGGRLTGEKIITLLQENYQVSYHPDSIYRVLKKLGLSWISGRSVHPKQAPLTQEAFKKTLPRM
jgi:transposase